MSKKYKVYYSEDSHYYKVFEASTESEAYDKARDHLSDNDWDTSDWETGAGGGAAVSYTHLTLPTSDLV